MKQTFSFLLVALLLVAAGELFRRAATFEDAVADAQAGVATQNLVDEQALGHAERAGAWGASLPIIGPSISADLRRLHAQAAYWRGDLAELLAPAAPGAPDSIPADPSVRFIAANAMFRQLASQPRADSQTLTRGLDAVLKAYDELLDIDPADVDASYNYEFVSRLRRVAATGKGDSVTMPLKSDVNGDKGAPPKETTPKEFNIIVPLQPDERQDQAPQGGSTPQRKG